MGGVEGAKQRIQECERVNRKSRNMKIIIEMCPCSLAPRATFGVIKIKSHVPPFLSPAWASKNCGFEKNLARVSPYLPSGTFTNMQLQGTDRL